MSILSMENTAMSAIEHAATWLVGHAANATTSLSDLTAKSSLVMDALNIGTEAAMTNGVATPILEKGAELVLGAALDLSRIMQHTAGRLPEAEPAPEPYTPIPFLAVPPLTKAEIKAEAKAAAADAKAEETDKAAGEAAKK